jgi:alpha-ketoglutarate-dependent taurine dioxygenase
MNTELWDPRHSFPFVVRQAAPAATADDLCTLIRSRRSDIEERVTAHGAILFRGFGVFESEDLRRVALEISPTLSSYVRGTTPREAVSQDVYNTTSWPRRLEIFMHCEMTYATDPPEKIIFACQTEPEVGGETPIADCRRVLERISPAVRDAVARRGLRIVQNLKPSGHRGRYVFHQTIKNLFGHEDPEKIAQYCDQFGIQRRYKPNGLLELVTPLVGIIRHPRTGEAVWFNHVVEFCWQRSVMTRTLGNPIGAAIATMIERMADLMMIAEDDLPIYARYGDGGKIPLADVENIQRAYRAETVSFSWQRGDVLLLDNLSVAHSRRAFSGPRKVLTVLIDRKPLERVCPDLSTLADHHTSRHDHHRAPASARGDLP